MLDVNGGPDAKFAVYAPDVGLQNVHGEWIQYSVACEYSSKPYLRLRGVCQDSFLDSLYYPMHVKDSQSITYPWNDETSVGLVYVGEFATQIYYDLKTQVWRIVGTWKNYQEIIDVQGKSDSKTIKDRISCGGGGSD